MLGFDALAKLPLASGVQNTPITADLAATESSDVAAFDVSVGNVATVSFAITETSDTVSITGTNVTTAALAATETSDTVAVNVTNKTTATLAATETSDTVAVNVTNKTTATLAATETSDTVAIAANIVGVIDVTLAATESSDTASFAVTAVSQGEERITGGGSWKERRPEYRIHPEYDDTPKKKRKRVERVGEQVVLAAEPVIETGIIEARPIWDVMAEMQQRAAEAEIARQERLRAIALADDEWLMVA